jgi:uncharacterized alkaline shock family protein YloU
MEETTSSKTTIAPSVLNTIVRLTTLETPGVSRMAPVFFPVAKSEHRDDEGVKIVVKDLTIYVDVYVVINGEENVRVVAEAIQKRVTRAISEMVGMDVAYVNVHVTDVDLEA